MQEIERRFALEGRLRELEQQFAAVLDSVSDAVIVADDEARVAKMNAVAQRLTGWSTPEAIGRPLAEVFRCAERGVLVARSGARIAIDETARGRDQGIVVFRPLTDARVAHASERASRLQDLTIAVAEARTASDVAAVVLEQGCLVLRAPRGLVGLLSEDGESLELLHAMGYPDDALAALKRLPTSHATPWTEAVRSGAPVFTEAAARGASTLLGATLSFDADALAASPETRARRERPTLTTLGSGAASIAAVPLAIGGGIIGVMSFAFDEPRALDEDDREFVSALARQCAQALDRARLFEAAAQARAAAEAASRAKDDFLSTLSHELRTPLTAILGWADILRTRRPDPIALGRALEIIERNAKSLVQLIEDMLDVSRIVTGKLRLELRKVDPAAAVRAAVDVVRPAAEAKRIVIGVSIDPAVGTIAADPGRLQQVVWNLLSNAVKFSPKGSHIEVRLETLRIALHDGGYAPAPAEALVAREQAAHERVPARAAPGGIRLQVIDTGAGIDAEFLPHVFERFRQAEGKGQRSGGGLGLGLAIVKHLVELHEGTITAHSEGVGRGATFTVTLPDRSRMLGMLGTAWATDPTTPMTRRLVGVRVVIVDDEPDARDLVATILRGQGASVTVAASAQEALTAVTYERPDVFVSDIGMPDEDGYTLLKKVRALGGDGRPVPALALTAYAGADDARMAAVAGFQRHLPKPVAPAALVDAVASLAARGAA